MITPDAVLRPVLDEWKSAVGAHDPQRVAALFTEDAVFQGLRPYSVGRAGVAKYYDAQPLGLAADYQILEARQPADNVVIGYLGVDFSFIDRPTLSVFLTIVLTRVEGDWYLSHYQVSSA